MADLGSGIKQVAEETTEVVQEVAEEVKDSLGQALEQGAQSVAGTQLTPQQIQQKQLEDQKQLAETRRKIKWHQDLAAAQRQVKEEDKQKKLTREQLEEQERKRQMMEEIERKQSIIPQVGKPGPVGIREDVARTRQEIGKGHGVGG